MIVGTQHGDFAITARATAGLFSVVRCKHPVGHRRRRTYTGELVVIEHRKRPVRKALIGGPWCEYVATYDLQGNPVEIERKCE